MLERRDRTAAVAGRPVAIGADQMPVKSRMMFAAGAAGLRRPDTGRPGRDSPRAS